MDLTQRGIDEGLIKFDGARQHVTYVHQNKRRSYGNPEERVQVNAFLNLVLTYGYDPRRIRLFAPVTIGSSKREADMIVYNDDGHTSAHIVVECKSEDVSDMEFKQAISQAFSYAATGTVRARYFWVTSKIKDAYFEIPESDPRKHIIVTDVPYCGAGGLANFKYAKGGGSINGQKLSDLIPDTQDKLTQRLKQAHNSLWGGGELNPSEAFDELDKLIFCKIWDEKKPRRKGEPYDFQIFGEDSDEKTRKGLLNRVNALYEEGRKKDPEVFKDGIRLNAKKLLTVVGYLEGVNLGETDLDSKGRAFETFMGSFFRGDFGQYFTPRPIVRFIVDVLPIKNDSLVLDTSCGSGGFLLHALDKIRREADKYHDRGTVKHHRHWHDFAEKNLFGIEINEQIARTAKMNMIIHDDGHTNVIAADGLLPIDDIRDGDGNVAERGIYSLSKNRGFAYGRFDFIITNPPFGSMIKMTEKAYMHQYGYALKDVDWLNPRGRQGFRENQSTEVLFLEQCHRYLAEGGYLAIVVPDGILSNSSMQYVRDGIEEKYRIVAVVSMPQTAFQATGAGVKSSVLFLKKHTAETTDRIQAEKARLQESIKSASDYSRQIEQIERDKKDHLKVLRGFENSEGLQGNALKQSEKYKEWKQGVATLHKEKADTLKDAVRERYMEQRKNLLEDHRIFMAIAEDIGYDATGRPTKVNELEEIGVELARFIEAIEKGEK